ncbi:LGFP repeat-containing protein [Microbacterium sp. CIAB417]|uniref:LGFP repeat-containing protein n=1 Tax=Microbacterium sp. CIAB417 TaxID=2860287 RepID=UPI001FABCBA2|nr:hypothetical protein [Microbacterium sp. CIAB417]
MPRIARTITVFAAATAVILGTVLPVSAATAASAPTGIGGASVSRVAGDPVSSGIVKTSLAGFKAGNIISDVVFTDESTMTEAQIQSFLNGKVKTCRSGYTCLKDLRIPTQSKAADKYCSAYSGSSSESAARIIYKVARACNINPQVLIVMLQKEQGLVTHTWPSDWRYNAAMGQACPDTAPCDVKFAGFFAQVYGAARQMQLYMEGRYFTWYAPGKTWNILYHPNASCGRAPVYVANKATSALYYYTPYQPNAAAMRAGYGTGDSCSSYGNRNFYNYFTDWFGSTQTPAMTPSGAIATEWKRMGGASGALGNPAAPVQVVTDPNGNGRAQKFTGGWIHSSSAGTYSSLTPIMTAYSAAGWLRGDLGWPATQTSCVGGLCTQGFAGGLISYASGKSATATFEITPGAIDKEYAARGGASGFLGKALAGVQAVSDANGIGLARKYAGGWIHTSEAGTFSSSSKIMTGYSAAGWLRGFLGWPAKAEQTVTDPNGNGVAQQFEGGWVHSSAKGSFASSTSIMTAYSGAGWLRGELGWPTSTESCTGQACVQTFAGGVISYLKGKAAVVAKGVTPAAITKAASAQTSVTGSLGQAQPVQIVADPNGSGLAQKFANGWVHSSDHGTFVSSSTIMTAYSKAGWLRGKLGWPVGVESCSGTVCSQSFEGGTIAYTQGKAAVTMYGVAHEAVTALRSAQTSALGKAALPVQVVSDANGNGLARKYANGWMHASDRGTFSSSAKIMAGYSAAGWLRGFLGWPVAAEQTVTDANGNGVAQQFEGGWIHSSGKGTYTSTSTIMKAYSDAGWVRGGLGWPVGAEFCTGNACAQQFAGGVIGYTKGQAAVATVGATAAAITAAATKQTAVTGSLGKAQASVQVVADPNGAGLAQKYAKGWVHSSARGTFVSSSTIMTAYSKAGWLRGKLGWPTSAETCTATACTQSFEGGTISYAPGKPATVAYK